jgi:hypothetical protein
VQAARDWRKRSRVPPAATSIPVARSNPHPHTPKAKRHKAHFHDILETQELYAGILRVVYSVNGILCEGITP